MAQKGAFLQGRMCFALGGHTHRYGRVVICINARGGVHMRLCCASHNAQLLHICMTNLNGETTLLHSYL